MIIQHPWADWFLTHICGDKHGFALPWAILIHTKIVLDSWSGKRLILHEQKHQEQWRRYGYVGFIILYAYQFLRYGYEDMPLELEAKEAESG